MYDAHEAFEIDKTKMKMLVPLDMNGKQLMNVNYDLKFGDIFKIIKCETRFARDGRTFILVRKDNNVIFGFSVGVYINSITLHNKQTFDKNATIEFITRGLSQHIIKLSSLVIDTGLLRNLTPWLEFSTGFARIELTNLTNNLRFPFDVDIIYSYI